MTNHDLSQYPEHIREHFEDPYHRGSCVRPTHVAEVTQDETGETIQIELLVDRNGTVMEAWFDGEGSVLAEAAASLLVEHIEGRTLEELGAFIEDDMLELLDMSLDAEQELSALLAWRALHEALLAAPEWEGEEEEDEDDDEDEDFLGPDLREEI